MGECLMFGRGTIQQLEPIEIFNSTGFQFTENTYETTGKMSVGSSTAGSVLMVSKGAYELGGAIDIFLPKTQRKGYTNLCWEGFSYGPDTASGAGTDVNCGWAKADQAKSGNWYNPVYWAYNYSAMVGSYGISKANLLTSIGQASTSNVTAATKYQYSVEISSVKDDDYVYAVFKLPGGESTYVTYGYITKIWLE